MNSPQPLTQSAGGANVAPTLGAAVGTTAGLLVASKLGLNPANIDGGGIVAIVSTLMTALFHWIGSKTGIPGLG